MSEIRIIIHVDIKNAKARAFVSHTDTSVEDNLFLFNISDIHIKERSVLVKAIKKLMLIVHI